MNYYDQEEKVANQENELSLQLSVSSWLCRICLNDGDKNIFDLRINEKCIASHLDEIANLKVEKEDGLPELICEPCLESLNYALTFKIKCKQSDKYLRNILWENIVSNVNSLDKLSQTKDGTNAGHDILEDYSDFTISDSFCTKSQIPQKIAFGDDFITLQKSSIPHKKIHRSNSVQRFIEKRDTVNEIKKLNTTAKKYSEVGQCLESIDAETLFKESRLKVTSKDATVNKRRTFEDLKKSDIANTLVQHYYNILPTNSMASDHESIWYEFTPKQYLRDNNEIEKCRGRQQQTQEYCILLPTRLLDSNQIYSVVPNSDNLMTVKISEKALMSIVKTKSIEKTKENVKILKTIMYDTEKVNIKINSSSSDKSSTLNAEVQQLSTPQILFPELYCDTERKLNTNFNLLSSKNNFIDIKNKLQNTNTRRPQQKKFIQLRRCLACNKVIANKKEFLDHRRTCLKKFQCPYCGTICCMKTLADHIASEHKQTSKKAPHICEICGKIIKGKCNFTKHRATHNMELPYKCDECPYRGRDPEFLRLHRRQHTGEKRYVCPKCDHRCLTSSNLSRHMISHVDTKHYKCPHCIWSFKTETRLDSHIRVKHKGMRTHICPVCKATFSDRKKILHHMRKKHKELTPKLLHRSLYRQLEQEKILSENADLKAKYIELHSIADEDKLL